jgi:Uma2 family endonuclease
VGGVLVEKPMGFRESLLAGIILQHLWNYLDKHDIGVAAGADGPVRLRLGLVRIPDVSFVSWKRLGGDEVPTDAVSKAIPELAIEILSESNTPKEIDLKLHEYFRAGVVLAWVIDPQQESVVVHTSPTKKKQMGSEAVLEGSKLLPGFKLALKDLFAKFRRRMRKH